MQFMLLFSRQGKLRLQKWYVPLSDKEKKKITRELVQTVLARKPKMCSFLEWRDLKIVYKRLFCLTEASLPSWTATCSRLNDNW
uniref:Adaptor related protein complex 1 subunit sigma 2 n=1 Tax=Crocodylus porosus TaxID=8502 RepID=A0A7M4ECW6_CROPO